ELLGLRAPLAGEGRVARERERRLAEREPGLLPGRSGALEEPPGAGEPAVADRALAAERPVVPRERGRHPRRVDRAAGGAVARIGPLAGVERHLGLLQEERRRREPFERLGRLLLGESLGEEPLRARPVRAAERLTGPGELVWHAYKSGRTSRRAKLPRCRRCSSSARGTSVVRSRARSQATAGTSRPSPAAARPSTPSRESSRTRSGSRPTPRARTTSSARSRRRPGRSGRRTWS